MSAKNKWNNVGGILKLAFLEGAITTHGLYEKTVLRRAEGEMPENRSRPATIRRLLREFDDGRSLSTQTVGEFLQEMRTRYGLTPLAVRRRLGVPLLTYRMLENDSVSPLKINLETWKRMRDLWKIPWEQLDDMIRSSHYLTVFRPSYKGTLLRYRKKTSFTYPPDARVSAARELYLRARLPLPLRESESLERLMNELKSSHSGHGND